MKLGCTARRNHALIGGKELFKKVCCACKRCCRLRPRQPKVNERRSPFLLVNLPAFLLACCKSFHRFVTVKPGFHMIAVIATIAEKKFSDRSNHSDQMETTLQRLQRSQRWQRQQSLGWNVFCLSDCCRCNR